MEKKKKSINIEITEMFMAKAGRTGWDRCFHGTIKREVNSDGNPIVFGKIRVNDGYIIASAKDQWELGEKLDEMVLMILDGRCHKDAGLLFDNAGHQLFLN